jgi:hypothetical protein
MESSVYIDVIILFTMQRCCYADQQIASGKLFTQTWKKLFKYCSVSLRRIDDPNDPGRFTDGKFCQIKKSYLFYNHFL